MQEEDLNFLGDNSLHNLHRRERWPASTAVAIQIGKGKTLGLRACGNQSRSQSGQGNGRSAPNSPCAHATICRELRHSDQTIKSEHVGTDYRSIAVSALAACTGTRGDFHLEGPSAYLTRQFLEWLSERPRTYGETMDAWRTSCPRLSIWEDALSAGLVRLGRGAF